MKKYIIILFCIISIACDKESFEIRENNDEIKKQSTQKIYHNIQVSYDEKKWNLYILEENKTLSFKNTYKGVFYIWVKDEKYMIKDTFKYYGNPKIVYYDNGVLKIKE